MAESAVTCFTDLPSETLDLSPLVALESISTSKALSNMEPYRSIFFCAMLKSS